MPQTGRTDIRRLSAIKKIDSREPHRLAAVAFVYSKVKSRGRRKYAFVFGRKAIVIRICESARVGGLYPKIRLSSPSPSFQPGYLPV